MTTATHIAILLPKSDNNTGVSFLRGYSKCSKRLIIRTLFIMKGKVKFHELFRSIQSEKTLNKTH